MDEIDYNAPSKVKNAAKKCKTKCQEHKELIIGLSVGLVIGATAVYLGKSKTIVAPTFNTDVTGDNNVVNNLVQVIELVRRGHPGKIILDTETGEKYASIRRAADAVGKS